MLLDDLYASVAARIILVGIAGGTERTRAEASVALAEALRQNDQIARVVNSPGALVPAELDRVFALRYQLSPTVSAERFTTDALHQALQQRLQELGSPLSTMSTRFLPGDPTAELRSVITPLTGKTVRAPDMRAGVWFSADGTLALLVAETHTSGFDARAQAPAIDAIRAAFTTINTGGELRLLLSGPGVLAQLSEQTIRSEATLLALASFTSIVIIIFFAYRSPRVVLLIPLPMVSAVLIAIALISTTYGGIQGVVLGFGATLIGVAVDYPTHLLSQLRAGQPVSAAMERIWPTMRLCALTTAIGYLAMMTTDLSGLVQLGLFAITGLLTAAIVTRYVLPSLLPDGWAPAGLASGRLFPPVPMRSRLTPWPIIAAGVLLFAALSALVIFRPPQWQNDLASLSPIPAPILAEDARLRAELGAPEAGHMVLITADSVEAALQRSEQVAARLEPLVETGQLGGFDAPSLYLPSAKSQRERQSGLPDAPTLRARLAEASAGLPFKAGLFEPFLAQVEAARHAPPIGVDAIRQTPLGMRLAPLLYPVAEGWRAWCCCRGRLIRRRCEQRSRTCRPRTSSTSTSGVQPTS
ncbi:MAG: MMPL family transporter [Rhodospirillales bacterium]|nr:MMPL family transporter [Rhodospirillales bacterium]